MLIALFIFIMLCGAAFTVLAIVSFVETNDPMIRCFFILGEVYVILLMLVVITEGL